MSTEKIFDALSSTARRRILALISEGAMSAGDIAAKFDMSKPAVSKHLTLLEAAGLIWREKRGQFIYYGMQRDNLQGTLAAFLQEVCPPSRKIKAEQRAKKELS